MNGELFNKIPDLLPQYEFRRHGAKYVASSGTTPCCQHRATNHLVIYEDGAHGLKCHRCKAFTLLRDLIPGGLAALQRSTGLNGGQAWITHNNFDQALKCCAFNLWSSSAQAQRARAYAASRGLSDDYMRQHCFGLVPGAMAWDTTVDQAFLTTANLTNPAVIDRLIAPYHDQDGLLIGYWARSIDSREPKYLYSPGLRLDSPYRISECDPNEPILVVEGLLSADILHCKGVPNVVAVGGSNLTQVQAAKLKTIGAKSLIISFDHDPESGAGTKGSILALRVLQDARLRAYVIPPVLLSDPNAPAQKADPDSFVLMNGIPAFQSLIHRAFEAVTFLASLEVEGGGPFSAQSMDTILGKIAGHIVDFRCDELTRATLVDALADMMGKPASAIEERLRSLEVEIRQQNKLKQMEVSLQATITMLSTEGTAAAYKHLNKHVLPQLVSGETAQLEFFNKDKFLSVVSSVPTEVWLTGWDSLDRVLKVVPGELVIVAARPRHGKSTFGYNLLINQLRLGKELVHVFYSHEVPEHFVVARLATILAHAHSRAILSCKEHVMAHYRKQQDGSFGFPPSIHKALDQLGEWGSAQRLVIVNQPGWTAEQIVAHATSIQNAGHTLGSVFVDYVEMLPALDRSASREQQVGQSIYTLRVGANVLLTPFIVLSQMNRGATQRPTLEGLRYSGQLEQEASIVLGLHNDSVVESDAQSTTPNSGQMELEVLILKNRSGEQATHKLHGNMRSGLIVNDSRDLLRFDVGSVEVDSSSPSSNPPVEQKPRNSTIHPN